MDAKEKIKELLDRLRDEADLVDGHNRPSALLIMELADEIGVLVDQL